MKYIVEIDEDGNKFWRNENGDLHREDGPAVELINGNKEWWLKGLEYQKVDFNRKIREKHISNIQNDMYEALKAMHKAFVEDTCSSNNFMGTEYSDEEQNAINKCVRAIGSFDLLKNG